MKILTGLTLMLAATVSAQPVVTIDGVKSSLIVESLDLRSGIECPRLHHWSYGDPHYRGQLDAICIDGETREGIPYDVCNGLGDYVAVTEWQSSGNTCYTEETLPDYCDGFSPQPPGCDYWKDPRPVDGKGDRWFAE